MTPRIALKRGLVIDRCQPHGIPPHESAIIEQRDMIIIGELGFDHVKVLFTPSSFMKDDLLDRSNLWYVRSVVDKAVGIGLPCLICLHPEPAFKRDYLSSPGRFEAMLMFYMEWSDFLRQNWSPDQVAFQLMTEPFDNYCDWNELHPRIWRAVRDRLPEHTLVLSGAKTGNLFGLLELTPVQDDNVYYGYTSYDPFTFTLQSWNSFFCGTGQELDCVGRIPYPANKKIIEGHMDEILSTVPEAQRKAAAAYAAAYGNGDYQQGNHGSFDRHWHSRRAQMVSEWREKHGKHLPVLCNEFGVMDHVMGQKYGGPGCRPEDRLSFVRDIREAMEEHDIGWSYWSFNETFTIFKPDERTPFGHDDETMLDNDLLRALGMHRRSAIKEGCENARA